jgi:hypothetical protein
MYINFPVDIPNLTSVNDNLKIYNQLMFFKTLPKRTRKMLFDIRAQSVFRYSACFAALGYRLVLKISASYLKSDLTALLI